jgi:hypothetical protein
MPLTYEEAREIMVSILSGREPVESFPQQIAHLSQATAEVLARRSGAVGDLRHHRLAPEDAELVRDVFWDLFRQGYITLGLNEMNPNPIFFRVSAHGRRLLETAPLWLFHDSTSYLGVVRHQAPDLEPMTATYLEEAVSSFYAGNLLSACVMLGVAAECEFLRLLDVAAAHPVHGAPFVKARKERMVSEAIRRFGGAVEGLNGVLPRAALEGLQDNLLTVQNVLRIARNRAGHPNADRPLREQVYVYLQLFAPFAGQCRQLRLAFEP